MTTGEVTWEEVIRGGGDHVGQVTLGEKMTREVIEERVTGEVTTG